MDVCGGTVHARHPRRALRIDRQVGYGSVPDVVRWENGAVGHARVRACRQGRSWRASRRQAEPRQSGGHVRARRALQSVHGVSSLSTLALHSVAVPGMAGVTVWEGADLTPTICNAATRGRERPPWCYQCYVGLGDAFWQYECTLCGRTDRHTHRLRHSTSSDTEPLRLSRRLRRGRVIVLCVALVLAVTLVGAVLRVGSGSTRRMAAPPRVHSGSARLR